MKTIIIVLSIATIFLLWGMLEKRFGHKVEFIVINELLIRLVAVIVLLLPFVVYIVEKIGF